MTDSTFYVEPDGDDNPTIWERAIAGLGRNQNADHVVARLTGTVASSGPEYGDLAFAVLARVLAPDQATEDLVARALFIQALPESAAAWDAPGEAGRTYWRNQARAVLAVLAEDPAVTK